MSDKPQGWRDLKYRGFDIAVRSNAKRPVWQMQRDEHGRWIYLKLRPPPKIRRVLVKRDGEVVNRFLTLRAARAFIREQTK